MIIKFWLFIKHYWYIPLVAVLLLCAFVAYRSKISSLLNVITSARDDHKKSLEKLSTAASVKIGAERDAADEHLENISSLNDEKGRKEIDVDKKIEEREKELEAHID